MLQKWKVLSEYFGGISVQGAPRRGGVCGGVSKPPLPSECAPPGDDRPDSRGVLVRQLETAGVGTRGFATAMLAFSVSSLGGRFLRAASGLVRGDDRVGGDSDEVGLGLALRDCDFLGVPGGVSPFPLTRLSPKTATHSTTTACRKNSNAHVQAELS